MLIEHSAKRPPIAPSAYVAPTAGTILEPLDLPGTVLGVPRGPGAEMAKAATRRYAEAFGRHRVDRVLDA